MERSDLNIMRKGELTIDIQNEVVQWGEGIGQGLPAITLTAQFPKARGLQMYRRRLIGSVWNMQRDGTNPDCTMTWDVRDIKLE
jgi:hypothetical protein